MHAHRIIEAPAAPAASPLVPAGPAAHDPLDLGFRATIGQALRERARADGDTQFVVSLERRMTYAELEKASADLARRMLARGIGKGTRVGLYYSYSHEWVVAWLAASRIGALVLPFSTLYAPRELGRVLRSGDVHVLVTGRTVVGHDTATVLTEALPSLADACDTALALREAPFLRSVWMSGGETPAWAEPVDLFAEAEDDAVGADLLAAAEDLVVPADLAVVVYTSGSSAEPKGIVHTHASVLGQSTLLAAGVRETAAGRPPKIVCGMPFFWVGGILTLAGSLLGAIPLLIMERFDAGVALELIERERATYLIGWPTLVQQLRAHPDFAVRDLSSAPFVTDGPVDVATVGTPEPGVPAHRGMTETMGTFVGIDARIVDPETGRTVPPGADGELHVRGRGVMAGYYGRERADVFDRDGWYHTGDKVFQVPGDGRLFYRGRFTDMIKTAGANVAPREVELAVEELPEVAHCIVFGLPDPQRGEEVVAVVAPAPGHGLEPSRLTVRARELLSAYKVPTRWIVVDVGALPWLGSGKPDKRRLKEMVANLSPEGSR
ncbi:class I adenylate-forming enzyme family protein [Pseudonocardia sp. RS010]|uniref:class I adenylate-forming enzyme family protein n=1 Tax=Pseudonocardia sp. RS010 TaxID=3385979 RepID=UPI0039A01A4B